MIMKVMKATQVVPMLLLSMAAAVALIGGGAVPPAEADGYTPEAQKDLIGSMPGLSSLPSFRQFSGFINVAGEGKPGKFMHYYFVESANDPKNDPVVMWSNGGPGCSGLLGAFTEQGPFRPTENGSLKANPYSWNKIANMVFIEAPVGVGFSYAEDEKDYHIGDHGTAEENYRFILGFFDRYPNLLENVFVITSESYGGHYMPTLARTILKHQANNPPIKLNFKGFAVGNPYTSNLNNRQATYVTFWGHQLVSLPTFRTWQLVCAGIRVTPDYFNACLGLEAKLSQEVGHQNPYALDYPVCLTGTPLAKGRAQRHWLLHHIVPEESKTHLGITDISEYEPCADNFLGTYMNDPAVKEAFHVPSNVKWEECSSSLRYKMQDLLIPMEPIYHELLNGEDELDILVYSGDDDSVCGLVGTQAWMWGLGYKVAGAKWEPWIRSNGQQGGYVTQWANRLTLATVHKAGHEVPTYMPEAALELFEAYLNGTWFDLNYFNRHQDEPENAIDLPSTSSPNATIASVA